MEIVYVGRENSNIDTCYDCSNCNCAPVNQKIQSVMYKKRYIEMYPIIMPQNQSTLDFLMYNKEYGS